MWSYPSDPAVKNFASLLAAKITAPDKTFIQNDDGRTLSYAEMWRLSGQLAGALADAGVVPGDRVAVQVDKSPEVIALLLACMRSGAALLPLNMAYTLAELDFFVGDAQPRALVCRPDKVEALRPLSERHGVAVIHSLGVSGDGTLMVSASGQDGEFADVPSQWNDIAAILYTSGTTGRSKGAMITHGNLASNALSLIDAWRFTAGDTLLHALPVNHVHGLFTATNTLMLAGGTILFQPKFDAGKALQLFPQVTTMMGVPTFYTRLLEHPGLTHETTAHMRLFISGSAPLLPETHAAFLARTGQTILERYGMTETSMNTSNPFEGARIAGTVGLPLPGVSVRVADPETGKPLGQDQIGMIHVSGPNVFKGYWRMPEKTAQEFTADGYFITGDLGRIGANGYLSIVGRGKDLIISGGFNVYPKEIESEIDAMDGVVESAVIGLPHKDFGEGVTAIVVAASNACPTEKAVLEHLATRLAKFKLPKRILFVDELPRNAMAKVQKAKLRETYARLYELDSLGLL